MFELLTKQKKCLINKTNKTNSNKKTDKTNKTDIDNKLDVEVYKTNSKLNSSTSLLILSK